MSNRHASKQSPDFSGLSPPAAPCPGNSPGRPWRRAIDRAAVASDPYQVATPRLLPAIALALAIAAGGPSPATAATDLPTEEDLYLPSLRTATRLAVGFDFGVGIFDASCSACEYLGGLSLDVYGGVLVSPRVALLVELWTLAHLLPADREGTSGLALHSFATLQGRLWMLPEVWMGAGVGAGALSVTSGEDAGTGLGPALVLSLGTEVHHRPDTGVDLALRLGVTFLEDDNRRSFELYQIAATVGWHWY